MNNRILNVIAINFIIFIVLISLIEIYCRFLPIAPMPKTTYGGDYNKYFTPNEFLGYAPQGPSIVTAKKTHGDYEIYNVTYTINKNGLRITPHFDSNADDIEIVFFGCSFTYGEGVQDEETTPYLVGKESKLNVHNFSFHGYGPHQMLSALQHGLVEKVVTHKNIVVIYQAIPHHVFRVANSAFWSKPGPKYSKSTNNQLSYDGQFLKNYIESSAIYKRLLSNRNPANFNQKNLNLYLEIVSTSRKLIQEKYPGAEFHVILWPSSGNQQNLYNMIKAGLEERKISIHLIPNILNATTINGRQYMINKHPNALANQIITEYILKHILGR